MKRFLPLTFLAGGTLLFTACETTTESRRIATVSHNDSTVTISKKNVERDFKDLKEWVNTKAGKADSNFERNLPRIKEDFKTRSAKIESRLDSLSEESKREYLELKRKYAAWEKLKNARTAQPLSETNLTAWRKELLGERADFSGITGANAKETYLLFMGIVRAKNQRWTPEDWDYVDRIYGELNDRKRAIENAIPAADRLKIKTLQAEYLALEAKADAADAYKHIQEK